MTIEPLILTRHFKAPPERVFAAFTEKALMLGWYGPEGMTVPNCMVDARVGGQFRVEMHRANGSVHIVTGEFKEIVPNERLVFSWARTSAAATTKAGLRAGTRSTRFSRGARSRRQRGRW
jgi:uncharacterized protein YndB with AHSA1/START domain